MRGDDYHYKGPSDLLAPTELLICARRPCSTPEGINKFYVVVLVCLRFIQVQIHFIVSFISTSSQRVQREKVMVPADSMSVAELRAELTQLRVRSSHCVEKHELVALLLKTREDDAAGRGGLKGNNDVRASSATRHSTATPGRTTTPVSRNSTYTNGRSSRSAAEEPAWQGYVIAAVIVAWLWNSVSDSAEGPRDLLVSDANSWAYDDTMKKAYIDGEVSEMRRHESYLGAISHHRDLTGLPVVVDIYSDGCGPCRQIAPIYKAAAKRFAGQAVFLKVDSMRNQRTVAALVGSLGLRLCN